MLGDSRQLQYATDRKAVALIVGVDIHVRAVEVQTMGVGGRG